MVGTALLPAAVVMLAAAVPYLPTLNNYFVQDDFGVVGLLSQKPASYFPRWFVSTWMDDIWGFTPDEVRPFPAVTYQIAAIWGAASPVANHIINIAFHAANALLVLGIARVAAGLSAGPALFAALVFAVLPMQAESVAWITGRVDSMPACFYLASFLLYARWRVRASDAGPNVNNATRANQERAERATRGWGLAPLMRASGASDAGVGPRAIE